jgi:hypothetical protein
MCVCVYTKRTALVDNTHFTNQLHAFANVCLDASEPLCVYVCVCVCERERERKVRVFVYMCDKVCVRERERVRMV